MKLSSAVNRIIILLLFFILITSNCYSQENVFSVKYDPAYTHMKAFEYNKPYEGIPSAMPHTIYDPAYVQPWSGYEPPFTKGDPSLAKYYPVQTSNIKTNYTYTGIEVGYNKWSVMACEEALISAQNKGGPFGAVILQIDDSTGTVIRYWRNHNHVIEWCDPTAHAEVSTIRAACQQLGVINLGKIYKNQSKLPQPGETSHCEIYVNAEPCPMCYAAISWANIPTALFAATCYDAAVQGVSFSDELIYHNIKLPYKDRTDRKTYQPSTPNSLDAFNYWKRSGTTPHY
jgi:tRNA(Arg) A34 adenosine deaminase TadA